MTTPLSPSALRLAEALARIIPEQMAIQPTSNGGADEVATTSAIPQHRPEPCAMLARGVPVFGDVPFDSRRV